MAPHVWRSRKCCSGVGHGEERVHANQYKSTKVSIRKNHLPSACWGELEIVRSNLQFIVDSESGLLWFFFFVICLENTRHCLNQVDGVLQPTATWSLAVFLRACLILFS